MSDLPESTSREAQRSGAKRHDWVDRSEAVFDPDGEVGLIQILNSLHKRERELVIAHAVAVFGDEQKASHWLATPLPLLDNRSPSQLLEAEGGIDLVEQVLTRIEHNIPS